MPPSARNGAAGEAGARAAPHEGHAEFLREFDEGRDIGAVVRGKATRSERACPRRHRIRRAPGPPGGGDSRADQ